MTTHQAAHAAVLEVLRDFYNGSVLKHPEKVAALTAAIELMKQAGWQPAPTESGWHWHFDGDVYRMLHVFPRPGHSYLAVQDEPNAMTGKRHFRMAEKIGGQWYGPLTIPAAPTEASR